MSLTLNEQFKFICIFGDAKEHNWFEVIFKGVHYVKVSQKRLEKIFTRCLEYGMLKRLCKAATPQDDTYMLTQKGDEFLREEQIRRGGDVSYYKYYDRTVDGPNGVNKYAPIAFPQKRTQKNIRRGR